MFDNLAESVTSSAPPASTASIPVDQAINVSVGKQVTVDGENGNSTESSGKQSSSASSSHEDRELQEWYGLSFLSLGII